MNPYLIFIVSAVIGRYLLELVADGLNLRHVAEQLPEEFSGVYDSDQYARSQRYLRDTTRFGILQDSLMTIVTLVFVLAGGFNFVDGLARGAGLGGILTGLLFAGILALATQLLHLPFSIYGTFVIEERYGFNKTTPRTYVLDLLKGLLLSVVIGGAVLAGVLWFFGKTGDLAWLYCWGAVSLFQVVLIFIAPYVIMPLFNRFEPLEDGDLNAAISGYAKKQAFRMRGVFKMDGSRRSSKSNAFFTGFGRSRRIVLFDTLIERHTVPELVAVVAHEMGHYRLKHIPKAIVRAILLAGVMFYLLSLFIDNAGLFEAFGMDQVSTYAGLIFFGYLYAPIGLVVAILENAVSRRHEFEADAYAVRTTGSGQAMVEALKKLCKDNLSNLTPHPFKVLLSYGHPPVLERIRSIGAAEVSGQ